jgi:hypothetical protein
MENGHQDVVQLLLETRRIDVKLKDRLVKHHDHGLLEMNMKP